MTDPQTDPTAAIEVFARLLCAADVHVNDGDHPTWQQLSTTPGRGQDEYRKAARWLLPRMTVTRPPADRAAVLREAGWAECSPEWLAAHPSECGSAPRVPGSPDVSHWHPDTALLRRIAAEAQTPVCVCGHPEGQHFEDACLVCDCGDYLTPAAAREVIARYQDALKREVDVRAAVLREAAKVADGIAEAMGKAEEDWASRAKWACATIGVQLRRLADEAQQQPELTPCTCRQAVHALEHHGRTIPTCPWCTPAPNIRPNQPAGRTVNTVDTRLLGTKET